MTLNNIISGKKGAREFYSMLKSTTLEAAAAEPLTLREVASMRARPILPTGEAVDYATALCFVCLQDLMSKFTRKNKPDDGSLAYMAKQISTNYPDWSVLDLPTFVSMCVLSRIPSPRSGQIEYELLNLDIPSVLGKVEAYDKMRPGKKEVQGCSPKTCRERPWDPEKEHKLFDGTPYEHGGTEKAKTYWKDLPDYDNPSEKATVLSILARRQGCVKKVQ